MRNKTKEELVCSIKASAYFMRVANRNGGIVSLGKNMGVLQSVASEYGKCDGASADVPFYRLLMAEDNEKIEFARLMLKGIAKVEPIKFDDLNGKVIDEFLQIVEHEGDLATQVRLDALDIATIDRMIDLLCKMKAEK